MQQKNIAVEVKQMARRAGEVRQAITQDMQKMAQQVVFLKTGRKLMNYLRQE